MQNFAVWIKILNFKTRGILRALKFQSTKSKSKILKFQISKHAKPQHGV